MDAIKLMTEGMLKAEKPEVNIGDTVKVLSMNLKGTVHTLPDAKGNLFVQMGILRSQVNIRDLELVQDNGEILKQGKEVDLVQLMKIQIMQWMRQIQ